MSYVPMISRVWNDNIYPYKEKFRDENIVIPAGKYIEMEHMDAVRFLGTYSPIIRDGDGQPMPQGYKKLRIERTSKPVSEHVAAMKIVDFTCMACKFKAKDQKELDAHCEKEHRHMWADEEEAERNIKHGKST